MTNRKTTKRALLGSVLALVLCFAMLLGSTYAWFTDIDTASAATITAGILDIELTVKDDNGNWVDDSRTLFETKADAQGVHELWEPGYAVQEIFKIENLGNLTVQYQARISYTGTLSSTLADNITVYVKDYGTDANAVDAEAATRAQIVAEQDGWKSAGSLTDFMNATTAAGTTTVGTITKEDKAEYLGVTLVMNTSATNECQGLTLVTDGTLTLTIVATQDMDEADDFGNEYDNITIQEMSETTFEKVTQTTQP